MKRAAFYIIATAAVVAIACLIYYFGFLRKPRRRIPHDDSLFVSPANGTIISIRQYDVATDGSYLLETKDSPISGRGAVGIQVNDVAATGTIITIALDITDVHYQRAPTSGVVVFTRCTAGDHKVAVMPAGEDKPRYRNEHNEILITGIHGNNYKVVQIAGFVARSIQCDVVAGQTIKQGQVLGCIKIGSQVTIVLPATLQVCARVGDYLIDGETILAKC